MQLYETLVFPPANHLANGGFHSNTCDHFSNQNSSLSASSPQNSSGFSAARWYSSR